MDKAVRKKESWVYRVGRVIMPAVTTLLFPYANRETVNLAHREGPFLVYCNHISMWDPVILGVMLLPRRTYFMAKEELCVNPFVTWLLKALGAILVKRGASDMQAIRSSLQVLRDGDVFAIFPEGTRNKERDGSLLPFYNGVSLIALRAQVPCIRVYIDPPGAYRLFRRVRIFVGQPVSFDDLREGKRLTGETLDLATRRMREGMESLIPPRDAVHG